MQLYNKTLGAIGTSDHKEFRERGMLGKDVGCFGMTELGHGSNVLGVGTTAYYDKKTEEFIINTPKVSAMKFWIGGAA